MRRDSIFYKIFQQMPQCLFELLPEVPENAADYRVDSVAVKEPKFEIDRVFLPTATVGTGVAGGTAIGHQSALVAIVRIVG